MSPDSENLFDMVNCVSIICVVSLSVTVSLLTNFFSRYFEGSIGYRTRLPTQFDTRLSQAAPSQMQGPRFDFTYPRQYGEEDDTPLTKHELSAFSKLQKCHMNKPELALEAMSAVRLAGDMLRVGRNDRASALYKHAVALTPSHPEVLTSYGEFLEKRDVLEAERLYSRALATNPDMIRARENRQRVRPLVVKLDHEMLRRLERLRDRLFTIPESHPGLKRAKEENYYLHIYHTNAIEGNTLTVSQTRALLQNHLAIGGKSLQEHQEVIGLDTALRFLSQHLLKRFSALTKLDILGIHQRVLGFVDPVGAGKIRNNQVYVGGFTPPPPGEVNYLLDELITWLQSDEASSLHPVELAALAHYKFVYIHPFYDGNGRTARLLMNLFLMRSGYPPVIVRVDDRHHYYETLQLANDGDVKPFIRFIANCTEQSINYFINAGVDHLAAPLDAPTIEMDEGGRRQINVGSN